jgi:hypothetical protein
MVLNVQYHLLIKHILIKEDSSMQIEASVIQQFINNELVQLPIILVDGKETIISEAKPVKHKKEAYIIAEQHAKRFLMKNAVVVPLSKLTAQLAKTWLLEHDSEGADIWNEISSKKELIESVKDNLFSFGIKNQTSTKCYITTNNSNYSDYGTNGHGYIF